MKGKSNPTYCVTPRKKHFAPFEEKKKEENPLSAISQLLLAILPGSFKLCFSKATFK